MKRLPFFLAALMVVALGTFALPVRAQTTNVTLTIPPLVEITPPASVGFGALAGDLNLGYVFRDDDGVLTVRVNTTGWALTAQLNSAFTGYQLWIDDTQTTGSQTPGAAWTGPLTTSALAVSTLSGYGTATGETDYFLDWNFAIVDWTDAPSGQTRTITWTGTI